jgi:D-alanyl-D-alanine carboxypeptidase/D-alanyl-D-alanine-endopeptidase (penicillin-binding protein 4)
MKKRTILGLICLLSVNLYAQTEPTVSELATTADTTENLLPWPQKMQSRLDSMMRDPLLDYTQMGIMVWDLTDDQQLFSMNQRQLLRPASTMKLVTAITALDYLGTDYQFTTSLYYTGDITGRTLHGNLYCVGGMDPAFSFDDMDLFARSVKELGIDTICGSIVADVSMKDTLRWGEGWCWDDDNPTLSPLLVDRKADFLMMFISALSNYEIVLHELSIKNGKPDEDAKLLSQRKRTLDQILLRMMKDSDNLYAEAVYYQVAAKNDRPAKALYAQRQQRATMERSGLNSSRYRLADGSGLSLYNYLSAECLLRLLRYAYKHKPIYEHLLPSLPVAGEDGTLKKRMKGTTAEGNIQAKTGTVTGVSALAGYCTASNGHRLAFAIINQGIQRSRDGRDFQDKVCEILCE